MWLWLRHFDGSTFLRFEPATVLDPRLLTLGRPFEVPVGELGPLRPDERWRPGGLPDGSLVLVDSPGRAVWRLGENGVARLWFGLADLPAAVAAPVLLPPAPTSAGAGASGASGGAAGRLLLFVADGPRVNTGFTDVSAAGSRFPLDAIFPALLAADIPADLGAPGRFDAISADAMDAPANYPVYTLRFTCLVPDPSDPNVLYAHDDAGGDLLRLTLER